MADTLHSSLTGSDLHESKGASSASSGQVAIANGAGAAVFGFLAYSQLTGTPTQPAFSLNGGTVATAPLVKVYTTTASSGQWSVAPTGFTTIWGVFATALDAANPTVATVATVSTSTITGKNVLTNSVTPTGTQATQVLVIGV
ncbi:hypothetical protein [Erwinia phage Pecta]|nr:hypothetical protein [Erwinia phage Pecta]